MPDPVLQPKPPHSPAAPIEASPRGRDTCMNARHFHCTVLRPAASARAACAPRARGRVALSALLALLFASSCAAAGETGAAARTLRASRLEPAPASIGTGRFRLRAQWQPAPAPALSGRSGRLQLSAALAAKAAAASCPLPGTIFSDGFEAP
jgi:hypothetical protein